MFSDFVGFTAFLFRSENICWLVFSPTSSKNTTDILSCAKSDICSSVSFIAATLCWPSLMRTEASCGNEAMPMLGMSSETALNEILPSTDTVIDEKI